MNISKDKLYICWYEDDDGNRYPMNFDDNSGEAVDVPEGVKLTSYHSRIPCQLTENIDSYIANPDESKGEVKFKRIMSCNSSWSPKVVTAMVKSGDFTMEEAITVYATACERCINVLWDKYVGNEGYKEFSEQWKQCKTSCEFCKGLD